MSRMSASGNDYFAYLRSISVAAARQPIITMRVLVELINDAVRHRRLIKEMTWRELADPFAGSVLGVSWSILHPLMTMIVYAVVFYVIFRGTVEQNEYGYDFAIQMMSAYLPWMAFMQAILAGCSAIRNKAGLVKQVVFPLEVLPIKTVAAFLVPQLVGSAFLFGLTLARFGSVPWTWVLWPFLMACEVLLLLGLVMTVSALGVYLRDLRDVLQVVFLVIFYATPILYTEATFGGSSDAVRHAIQTMIAANPISYYVWPFRDACFFGEIRHPVAWIVLPITSIIVAATGYRIFRKLKPYFGNAL